MDRSNTITASSPAPRPAAFYADAAGILKLLEFGDSNEKNLRRYLRMRKEQYSSKARKALKQKVLTLPQKCEVFVYFKHEEPGKRSLCGRVAVGDQFSMLTGSCKGLSPVRSSPFPPRAVRKSFPPSRAFHNNARRSYVPARSSRAS